MAEPKGSRLDINELPDDWLAWAIWHGAEHRLRLSSAHVAAWFEEFRDYWIAIPGQRGRKLDWLATWRNHIRKEVEREIYRQRRYGGREQDRAAGLGYGVSAAARARDRERGSSH